MNFPASELEALRTTPRVYGSDTALLQALPNAGTQIVLTPAFLGLLGASGTLPLHKTERIAVAQRWKGDGSARAFVDLFSQRMISMFFQAWGKYRPGYKLDMQAEDSQQALLLALAGISRGMFSRAGGSCTVDIFISNYSALLHARPVSASTVSRVLTNHFGVPIELEPFVCAWELIPSDKRSRLGGEVARLGYGATLGARLKRRDNLVRLNVGPLDQEDAERFFPCSAASMELARLVPLFGLPNLKFEVWLILKPSCIQRLVLPHSPGAGRRLGRDAFLPDRDGKAIRNAMGYALRPTLARCSNAG